jgi:hypothetical protein
MERDKVWGKRRKRREAIRSRFFGGGLLHPRIEIHPDKKGQQHEKGHCAHPDRKKESQTTYHLAYGL